MAIRWIEVRDALVVVLKEVPGVAQVHSFPRVEKDRHISRWRQLMSDTQRINAWTVLRTSAISRLGACKQVFLDTNALLVGILEHSDEGASQDEFDSIIDEVLLTFFKAFRLTKNIDYQGPAELQVSELRQVANTPIHYCEIAIQVHQTVNI